MKLKKISSFLNIFGNLTSLFKKSKLQDEYEEVIVSIVKNNEFDDYFAKLIEDHDYVAARKFLEEGYEPNKNNELLLNNLAVAAFYRNAPESFKKKEFIINDSKVKDIAHLLNRCSIDINILDYYLGKKTILDNPTKNTYVATEKVETAWAESLMNIIYKNKNSTIVHLLDEEDKDLLSKYNQDIKNEEQILSKGIFNIETIYVYHFLINKYNINQDFYTSCEKVKIFFGKFEHYKQNESWLGKRKVNGNYTDSIEVSLNMILLKNIYDFVKENSIEYQDFVKNVVDFKNIKDFRFHTLLGIFDTDNFASKLGSEHWKKIENERYNNITFDYKIKEHLKNFYDNKRNSELEDVIEKFKKVKESSKLENLLKTNDVAAIEYLIDSLGLKSSKTSESLNKIQDILSDLENKKLTPEVNNFISNVNKEIINTLINYDELKKVDLSLDVEDKLSNVTFDILEQLKLTYINVLKEQLKELETEVPINKKRLVAK